MGPPQKWSSWKWSSWKLTRVPPEVVMEVVMEVDQGTPPGSGHLEVVTKEDPPPKD